MRFLVGKYYHCIGDHEAGKYDLKNPHFHRIVDAEWCEAPHDAKHGLKLYLDISKWSPVYSGPIYVGNGESGFQYIYEKIGEEFKPWILTKTPEEKS